MTRKTYAVLNLLSIIILIAWNGYANTGNFNGKTVGDLSAEYNNLFTPASYAFSIWGLIFLMLIVYGIYGVYYAFAKAESQQPTSYREDPVLTTAPYFLLANIFCTVWVGFWLSEMVFISVLCMLGILVCLLICVKKLDLEIWDAPFPVIAFIWWPLCLYSGWISVATIANISAWLNSSYEIAIDTQVTVTLIMIVVAAAINIAMIFKRNTREYAIVGAWALFAIYYRFKDGEAITSDAAAVCIAYTSISLAILIVLCTAYHGYKNRATNPMVKFMEWRNGS